jgi:hypothetical protein
MVPLFEYHAVSGSDAIQHCIDFISSTLQNPAVPLSSPFYRKRSREFDGFIQVSH